jgi:peptidoglycan hydrolase-like protein with peptidoglycan-binding domain
MLERSRRLLIILSLLSTLTIFSSPADAAYTKCKVTPSDGANKYCFRKGDRGTYIQKLSMVLSHLGYYQGKPKNLFDKELEQSVIKFQREYRLKSSDGVVGGETLVQMCKAKGKGCAADAGNDCYTGSPRNVIGCLNDFKSDAEKDRSYFNK